MKILRHSTCLVTNYTRTRNIQFQCKIIFFAYKNKPFHPLIRARKKRVSSTKVRSGRWHVCPCETKLPQKRGIAELQVFSLPVSRMKISIYISRDSDVTRGLPAFPANLGNKARAYARTQKAYWIARNSRVRASATMAFVTPNRRWKVVGDFILIKLLS